MYQHDKELTEKWAKENPDILDKCRKLLAAPTGNYKCTVNFHVYYVDKTSQVIACPVCGERMEWVEWGF